MEKEEQRNSRDVSYILHSALFNIGRVPKTIGFVSKEDVSKSLSGTAATHINFFSQISRARAKKQQLCFIHFAQCSI